MRCPSLLSLSDSATLSCAGTTTPISFVKDVLFPYAEKHLKSYLERTWTHERTVAEVEAVRKQAAADKAGNLKDVPPVPQTDDRTALLNAVVENLLWNMAKDRKVEALKEIQGHIWEEGYSKGDLHSIVYPDAAHFFARLVDAGVRVAIYSSGSRDAQRLLFKHSDQGDLRSHISCYFDTKVGGKRETASYLEIVKSLGVDSPSDILFVTDVAEEATAALEAGLKAVVAVRPGNGALPKNHKFETASTFDDLMLSS